MLETVINYYENENGEPNKKKIKEIYTVDSDSGTGEYMEYYKNGKLKLHYQVKNQMRRGYCYRYHKRGNIWHEGDFYDGKECGVHLEYYQNGMLKSRNTFTLGRLDGKQEEYDELGRPLQIYCIGEFIDDGGNLIYGRNGVDKKYFYSLGTVRITDYGYSGTWGNDKTVVINVEGDEDYQRWRKTLPPNRLIFYDPL